MVFMWDYSDITGKNVRIIITSSLFGDTKLDVERRDNGSEKF